MNKAPIYENLTPRHASLHSRRVRATLSLFSVVAVVVVSAVIGSGIALHPNAESAPADPSNTRLNTSAQLRQVFDTTPVPTVTPVPAKPVAAVVNVAVAPSPSPVVLVTRERVQEAESSLRTGHFVVNTKYDNGAHTMMDVLFVLGDAQTLPRLHVLTTYAGALNTQTLELVVVGQQAWQRPQGGEWALKPGKMDVTAQVMPFLPHIANTSAVMDRSTLRWYDTQTNADIVLDVDPGTGVPRQLQQTARMGAPTFIVNYGGWNTPVSIDAPDTK